MDEPLSASRIRAGISETALIGREVIVREETTSTNDDVWRLAKGGAPEGLVVFAERQTAGRGQRGNVWESAARKGLWLSILLRPNLQLKDSARLTTWAAKAIAWTVDQTLRYEPAGLLPEESQQRGSNLRQLARIDRQDFANTAEAVPADGHKATIKSPNDIYIGGRKAAGVLVEMRAQVGAPHLAVVGLGLNVNQQTHDFSEQLRQRTISMAMVRGGPLDRTELAIELLQKLNLTWSL